MTNPVDFLLDYKHVSIYRDYYYNKNGNVIFEVSEKMAIDPYDMFRAALKDYTESALFMPVTALAQSTLL